MTYFALVGFLALAVFALVLCGGWASFLILYQLGRAALRVARFVWLVRRAFGGR